MLNTVSRPVVVAIANNGAVVTYGVAALLKPFKDRVRVEEYAGRLSRRGPVDVVLYDPLEGQHALGRMSEIAHETGAQVLVYAWTTKHVRVDEAMRAGAAGFLSRTVIGAEMVTVLEAVAAGTSVKDVLTHAGIPLAKWPGESEGLTARESVIMSLVVAGMSNQEIADALYVSMSSVKAHLRSAYRTIGVASRTQAVVWGVHHGFQIAARSTHSRRPAMSPAFAVESA